MVRGKSPLFVIFITVMIDLIGFGMVIPLVGLYGRHFEASGFQLSLLGGIYSLMSFLFAPFWGTLSDRWGRRPVILISLVGSTTSYVLFALAQNYEVLLVSRALGGLFAGNISAAQAYIADITKPSERAKGMGMIGAAFGLGFTLGPPLGGISSATLGLSAPGWIAAGICGVNAIVAYFRLPESLPEEKRGLTSSRSLAPLPIARLKAAAQHQDLWFLLLFFFMVTFAFSNMEQALSLLLQSKFNLETGDAGYKTGLVLMVSGITGAVIQGGLIRKWAPRFGERRLLMIGLFINLVLMAVYPFGPTYSSYFILSFLMAFGTSLINPSITSLTSQAVGASEQGATLGLSQGLGSLARALGPLCGLTVFEIWRGAPFWVASLVYALLIFGAVTVWRKAPASASTSRVHSV